MSQIVPTVTAEDIDNFIIQYKLVSSFANRIHLDIMDGKFAPTISPTPNKSWFGFKGSILDIHIMHSRPELVIDDLLELSPSLVIVHAESNTDVPLLASKLRLLNIKTGIALLPETNIDEIEYILPHVQHVLIFGGHLGFHGGVADLKMLEKAKSIKSIYKNIELSWDGGANINNIKAIVESGIDVVNVGSAIHTANNPKDAYLELSKLSQ
jgi:ribulose-phosphate 3-epimerase